jgi:hypothetical protein
VLPSHKQNLQLRTLERSGERSSTHLHIILRPISLSRHISYFPWAHHGSDFGVNIMGLFWKFIVRIISKAYFDQTYAAAYPHFTFQIYKCQQGIACCVNQLLWFHSSYSKKNVKYLNSHAYFWYIKEAHYSS